MLNQRYRAFTLIELLVVISIIALLIGILLPGLNSARNVARTILCMSQMRQLSVAEHSYESDHDRFARLWAGSQSDGEAENVTVVSPLQSYLGVSGQGMWSLPEAGSPMHCPLIQPEDLDELRLSGIQPYPGEQYSSYGINSAMYFDRWDFSFDAVPNPSDIILIGEQALEPFERLVTADNVFVGTHANSWTRLATHFPQRGYRHHEDQANMAYVDGHVARTEHNDLVLEKHHFHWWDEFQDTWNNTSNDICACGQE